jgi:sugar lactone lactonase YvrE
MANIQSGEDSGANLARINLQEGRVVRTYPLAGPVLLNDLARATDGSIYVTESNGGTIYRLAPSGTMLAAILPAGTWEGPNGIVVLPSGALLVADFHGLSLVHDPAGPTPRLTRLTAPDGLYLGGIDGLALAGNRVIGIQNLAGRGRIWSLAIDASAGRIAAADLRLRGHPDLRNPTTGVVLDGRFLFIADPKLQQPLPGGGITPPPTGRTGHKLLALDLATED